MPKCKKCDATFPNTIEIEGKLRHLSRRSYCLDCSPFKKHNTKQIHIHKPSIGFVCDSLCQSCGRIYAYKKGCGSKTRCRSCITSDRRFERKDRCIQYKGGSCIICGYNKCPSALSFHHRDPEQKKFEISSSFSRKWDVVREELDKCDLLCSNCHLELHYSELNTKTRSDNAKIAQQEIDAKKKVFEDKKIEIEKQKYLKRINKPDRPSKEWLAQLLWMMPTTEIAQIYEVSDKCIEKLAKKYGLDKPSRGYWAKLNASKGLKITDSYKDN